jgi:DNA-binding NarL/FixJ family response regulator
VDDHEVVREGLMATLAFVEGVSVVGVVATGSAERRDVRIEAHYLVHSTS